MALLMISNPQIASIWLLGTQTIRDKVISQKGNSPEQAGRSLRTTEWTQGSPLQCLSTKWAWKQPSFSDSVTAQWSEFPVKGILPGEGAKNVTGL